MSTLIEAISRGCKGTLSDGSVRYTIEIEPRYAADAAKLFGMPGTGLAVAALIDGSVKNPVVKDNLTPEKPKGGELSKWAGILCNTQMFWQWLTLETLPLGFEITNGSEARARLIEICGIESRKELDHDKEAGRIFREEIMAPFDEWKNQCQK
jgi:hypothetical protein